MTRRLGRFMRQNTIALLAVFLALGGTTYAASSALGPRNSVASPQVVNGSLKTLDLSKKARKALKGNRGLRGFTGLRGAAGPTGRTGPTGATGPSASKYLLALQSNGTVTRQQGGVTAARTGLGSYTITFPQDVTQCYPVANIFAATGYVVMNGFLAATLFVNTYNSSAALADEAFYLAVFC